MAARYGGTYITHQRSESDRIDESLDEAFRIAREVAIPSEIYHLKVAYRQNWGRMAADLVALDPNTVIDRATYRDPLHYSAGIPYVAVNGQMVVDGGRITDARTGRVLHGSGWRGGAVGAPASHRLRGPRCHAGVGVGGTACSATTAKLPSN